MDKVAATTLARLTPRLREVFTGEEATKWPQFEQRLDEQFEPLLDALLTLYGHRFDFFYHLESILQSIAAMWLQRSQSLKTLDDERRQDPHWFQSHKMVGGVCYVDLFAENLAGIRSRIPYFKELGITYLHLMPLFYCPEENSDGGYAVSDYRRVNPALGSMEELAALSAELRANGISLVLDFIYNHTSDEHEWARRAQAGEPDYEEYYYLFDSQEETERYAPTLREIFPDDRPGCFTYREDMGKWVWTSFYSFQWDLNYSNPAVFKSMAEEMLFIANQGVEILRLDAVVFAWKEAGTSCENLPNVHVLINAYNAVARIAAPALQFKSEAIVHPDDVVKYIAPNECQISYNPLLMASLWEALATRETTLLSHALQNRFKIHPECAWANFVRGHDDIGWSFSDEDAALCGIIGFDHRNFLNSFYTGQFAGSFAHGLPFQYNPKTGDCRISGTCASLAGLEKALREETEVEVQMAMDRIVLLYGIILSIGGIPLIYLGDEIGLLNDYTFEQNANKRTDSRWVHRPRADWSQWEKRNVEGTTENSLFMRFKSLIEVRQKTPALTTGETLFFHTASPHLLAYVRRHAGRQVIVIANFSEATQQVAGALLRNHGVADQTSDLVSQQQLDIQAGLNLDAYQMVWLEV